MTRSQTVHTNALSEFALAVSDGLGKLGQRELPSMYLYDDLGVGAVRGDYPPPGIWTHAGGAATPQIAHAGAMVEQLPPPVAVVELGKRQRPKDPLYIGGARKPGARGGISPSMLRRQRSSNATRSSAILARSAWLDWNGRIWRDFRKPRPAVGRGSHSCVLFLGSSIGNFDRPAAEHFLRDIRRQLQPGDALPLGTDVEKSVHDMLLAYDDPAGVTAAFNLNLLARINRELGGDFILSNFAHEVRYQGMDRRIEMHLRLTRRETICISAADFICTLREGETIWTEACHKFRIEDIPGLARRTGFICPSQWIDTEWAFANNLLIADQ